jgi:hypothetical protein
MYILLPFFYVRKKTHVNNRATEAYLMGNKAAAKQFSLEAHRLNQQLSELHKEASYKIFSERNTPNRLQSGILDLHGLHDEESVQLLSETLKKIKNSELKVITGTGHHSRLGYASVEPAIRQFLIQNNYKWKQGKMKDGRGGLFTIFI